MRKKVLLVWWYDRRDLIAPYLEMQDEIEFTVLFYRFPHQENKEVAESLPFRRVYWLDYISPYQLLKDVQPEKILFLGNQGLLNISLIAAANVLDIATCYISHGIRTELREIISNINKSHAHLDDRFLKNNKNYTSRKWHSLLFFLNTLTFKSIESFRFVLQSLIAEMRGGIAYEKLKRIKSPLRKIKYYYLFAPENALMIKELDNPQEANIFYIGPYLMDKLFKELSKFKEIKAKNYWLIIDQPISSIKEEDRFLLYNQIAQKAAEEGKELIIKLHPIDYNKDLKDFGNVKYIRHSEDLSTLISEASGIISYYSALLLPILCYKKCILFDTNSTEIVRKWESLGVAKVLNLNTFDIQELDFNTFDVSNKSRKQFINQFVSYIDGEGTKRLYGLILSDNT